MKKANIRHIILDQRRCQDYMDPAKRPILPKCLFGVDLTESTTRPRTTFEPMKLGLGLKSSGMEDRRGCLHQSSRAVPACNPHPTAPTYLLPVPAALPAHSILDRPWAETPLHHHRSTLAPLAALTTTANLFLPPHRKSTHVHRRPRRAPSRLILLSTNTFLADTLSSACLLTRPTFDRIKPQPSTAASPAIPSTLFPHVPSTPTRVVHPYGAPRHTSRTCLSSCPSRSLLRPIPWILPWTALPAVRANAGAGPTSGRRRIVATPMRRCSS